jgi:hypothetical protein
MDDQRVAHGRLHTRATWWRRWWRRRSQGAHSVREPSGLESEDPVPMLASYDAGTPAIARCSE